MQKLERLSVKEAKERISQLHHLGRPRTTQEQVELEELQSWLIENKAFDIFDRAASIHCDESSNKMTT